MFAFAASTTLGLGFIDCDGNNLDGGCNDSSKWSVRAPVKYNTVSACHDKCGAVVSSVVILDECNSLAEVHAVDVEVRG